MTGRLIKYEIRSSIKLIGVIWIALVVVSILVGFVAGTFQDIVPESFAQSSLMAGIQIISGLLYFAVFVALIVATIMIVILRFYKGLLGNEGYMMHTLPVKPWQLITAKGIVAAGVVLVGIIVAILSFTILFGIGDLGDFTAFFKELFEFCSKNPKYILVGFEVLIIIVLSLLKSIYQIYASLAIGQLAGKYRILLSLGAYIALSIILSILGVVFLNIGAELGIADWMVSVSETNNPFELGQLAILGMFVLTVIQLAAFHVITERILSKKLNLQ